MKYVWDENKSRVNLLKHGVGFEIVFDFRWDLAFGSDPQIIDGELRELWIGPIRSKLFALVVTQRNEQTRVISLRPATRFEKAEWKNEFQR